MPSKYGRGGPRERQFTLLKSWAATHTEALRQALSDRFVLFGEWLYARHTVFYDALPHYFLEFDILDQQTGHFLATPERRALLRQTPVRSVPVLKAQAFDSLAEVIALLGPSTASTTNVPMEGLYLKVEEEGRVVERYKWVRPEFLQAILDSGEHWADRPIEPNQLADPGVLYV